MFPVATQEKGDNLSVADINLQQAGPTMVPVPMPNTSKCMGVRADTVTKKVRIRGRGVLTGASVIMTSQGDNTANAGVKSGRTMGESYFPNPSKTVRMEGIGVVTATDMVEMNGMARNSNSVGIVVTPSQTVVFAMK